MTVVTALALPQSYTEYNHSPEYALHQHSMSSFTFYKLRIRGKLCQLRSHSYLVAKLIMKVLWVVYFLSFFQEEKFQQFSFFIHYESINEKKNNMEELLDRVHGMRRLLLSEI